MKANSNKKNHQKQKIRWAAAVRPRLGRGAASGKIKDSVELAVCYPKKLLVPYQENQFRPHLIRWQGLALAGLMIVSVQALTSYASTGRISVLGSTTSPTISGLLTETNEARQKSGLTSLKLSTKLDKAAAAKADDMMKNNYWAHVSPSGVQPWFWLDQQGYSYQVAGENLAKNYASSSSTVKAWLASPTHRANVLNSKYSEVGFAVVDGKLQGQDTTLVVALYGEPESSAVLSSVDSNAGKSARSFSMSGPAQIPNKNIVARLGAQLGALDPFSLGILMILLVSALVAALTFRKQYSLPEHQKAKYGGHRRFGYKTAVFMLLAMVIIMSVQAGQI